MIWLILASVLWSFSFGLINEQLTGLDPVAVAAARLVLAALAFAPALVRARLPRRTALTAALLGAVQFGLMYVLYIWSYRWLPGWKVALFTVFTPFFVIWIDDLAARRVNRRGLVGAALAVVAALWVQAGGADGVWSGAGWSVGGQWRGFVLLQGANLCFAIGQVRYRRLAKRTGTGDAPLLAWMYVGAAVFTLVTLGLRGGAPIADWDRGALLALLYLGLAPTALGFWLWNRGAARTGAGPLAAANDLKIPLAVLTAWIVFGEQAEYGRALLGLAGVAGALLLARPARERAN